MNDFWWEISCDLNCVFLIGKVLCFPYGFQNIFFVFSFQKFGGSVYWHEFLWVCPVGSLFSFLNLYSNKFRKCSTIISSNSVFQVHLLFLLFFWVCDNMNVSSFGIVSRVPNVLFFFLFLFLFLFPVFKICMILSSGSLIISSGLSTILVSCFSEVCCFICFNFSYYIFQFKNFLLVPLYMTYFFAGTSSVF